MSDSVLLSRLRSVVRPLLARPGFSAVVVLTLALGIGLNTAIYTVLDAALIRTLPFRSPERLVRVDQVQLDHQVVEVAERSVAMDPRYHWGHYFLAWGLESLGEHGRALEAAREAVRVAAGNPVMRSVLGRALALVGDASAARQTADDIVQAGRPEEKFAYEVALIHLGLGEREEALGWLERARTRRSGWLAYLEVDPRLDPLRAEPRFQVLSRETAIQGRREPA